MKMPLNDSARARAYFEQKLAFTLGPLELLDHWDEGHEFNLIDVRDRLDHDEAHIPGSRCLPEAQWSENGSQALLSTDQMNVFYGYSGVCQLAARAALLFSSRGFSVMELDGGFEAWEDYELDVEGSLSDEKSQDRAGQAA
jgi:rhodanese-related sulfurtransferase